MPLWTFKCFISQAGRDVINEWYEELPPKAQAKFDTILEHFRDTPHNHWGGNYFFPLTGYEGIFEIRFRINNVLYRPLGCFGPYKNDFTFLIGAKEIGDEFVPKNAPKIALERQDIIFQYQERAYECDF